MPSSPVEGTADELPVEDAGIDAVVYSLVLCSVLRDDAEVVVFLMGDAVTCAIAGQRTPDGYYALDRMLRSSARHDGRIACCGICLDRAGSPRSS